MSSFHLPIPRAVPLAMVTALACILGSGTAPAQGIGSVIGTWDYYKADAAVESVRALRNVEQFHIEPGVTRMKERNFGGAYHDFEFILNFFPNHPRALILMSDLCDVNWKSPQCDAGPFFVRAIELNPEIAQTHTIYGLHQHRRKDLDGAVKSYQRAIAINPASANAHYNLGLAYFDLKRFADANLHAQASYALGFPLPGLKNKLTRAKEWKPLPEADVKRAISPVAAAGSTAAK